MGQEQGCYGTLVSECVKEIPSLTDPFLQAHWTAVGAGALDTCALAFSIVAHFLSPHVMFFLIQLLFLSRSCCRSFPRPRLAGKDSLCCRL